MTVRHLSSTPMLSGRCRPFDGAVLVWRSSASIGGAGYGPAADIATRGGGDRASGRAILTICKGAWACPASEDFAICHATTEG